MNISEKEQEFDKTEIKLLSMDHNQRHSFPKTFSNSEHENPPSNEEDGKVCSLSDLNESESCITGILEIANNFDLCANDDVANNCLESQQYRFGESEQENIQLMENNTNFSNMNISNENTAFNLALDSLYMIEQGNPLDSCSPNCLLSVPPYTSDDKEIGNYLTTSNISGSESNASESFKVSEKGTFLNNTNIQMTSGGTGNCGISLGQRNEDVQGISKNGVEPLKQTVPGAQASDNSSSSINGELLVPVNDIYAVAGASSTNAEVKRHKDGRFFCSICGKGFGRKSSLVSHYRTHTGEKPFTCDKCDKKYSQKGDLTRHLRTHTEERPYVCDKCGKRFNKSDYLAKHNRTHTGEKPYTCSTCGKAFSRSFNRDRHYNKVHNKK